jgi:hypothetical protein
VDGRDASGARGTPRRRGPRPVRRFRFGRQTKREVGGDAVASAWSRGDALRGPLVSVRVAARGRWRSAGLVAGPRLGQKWRWVEEGVGGLLSVEVVFL